MFSPANDFLCQFISEVQDSSSSDTVSNICAMNSWISFWIVLISDLKQSSLVYKLDIEVSYSSL